VVGVLENGDTRAPRVLAGDLHGVLDGLRARVHEHRLLRVRTGGVGGEQLGDAHVLLVRGDREERVDDLAQLLPCGRDDGVIGVTDGRDADAGPQVEERVAVDIHDDRPVGALDVDRQGR
jgi:hypothetical protein